MPKPSIDYLNARRALKPASGGAMQDWSTRQAPIGELELEEQTELAIASAWSDYRIRAAVMWQISSSVCLIGLSSRL